MLFNVYKISLLIFFVVAALLINTKISSASDTDAKKLFEDKCSQCHSLDLPKSERHDAQGWANRLQQMRSYGAVISDAEAKKILRYLLKEYGKK